MLQVKNLKKEYITGDLKQTALDNVSIDFRNSEFVAILGPSGSGKTTLLNVIGGLDKYDSGDIIINNVSTKEYKDKDWDSYRNHSVGFVFQNYNLIPHQTILSNVELALTLSGINRKIKRKLALKALKEVGLEEQAHKKPNQLSGGQMQRVAIARALVNNPEIVLADEPTGALDTETSIQIMNLLKEVSKNKLVIMVTHNAELAEEYATRIIKVKDGKILSDSNKFKSNKKFAEPIEHKNFGKSSMNFLTSLSLSFNNLKSKKGRTILTSFAGSIGIIGIALIMSFSNGVNKYISDIQKDVMTSYPLSISEQSLDLTSVFSDITKKDKKQKKNNNDGIYSNNSSLSAASSLLSGFSSTNNLSKFKEYLDDKNNKIHQYIGSNGIVYSYNVDFDVYSRDKNGVLVTADNVNIEKNDTSFTGTMTNSLSALTKYTGQTNSIFQELLADEKGLVSDAIKEDYEMLYGNWPKNNNEVVMIVNQNNEISVVSLYDLGLLPSEDYNKVLEKLNKGEEIKDETIKLNYTDIINQNLYFVTEAEKYVKGQSGFYEYKGNTVKDIESLLNSALNLKIVGIIKQKEDAKINLTGSIGYTQALTNYAIDKINNSNVVKDQEKTPDTNVINGYSFVPKTDEEKISDIKLYFNNMTNQKKVEYGKKIIKEMYGDNEQTISQISNMSENQLIALMSQSIETMPNEELINLYNTYISTGSYDENMKKFGRVSKDSPSVINIYVDSFEDKDNVTNLINEYNKNADEKDKISYTDYIGLLLSSVTTIINVISIVLIAFVSVSLIVSSIMIGIITYISVLERTKEIGILRAIGASKKNISQVFNAETLIIGLLSGIFGMVITILLLIPGNMIIHNVTGIPTINAFVMPQQILLLIALSIILTLIGGLIPAKGAAKKDPVSALRSE